MLETQHSRYGAITRMLPPTLGKVFFVIHADNTSDNHLLEEFPVDRDGVPRVYQTITGAATDQLAIQAALDACVAGRGDYVIVMPSNSNDYDLGAKLTMTKADTHLITLEVLTSMKKKYGASRGVVLEQTASDDLVCITGRNCEFAGFYMKPKTGYSSVEGGAGCYGVKVHHNTLYAIGTAKCIDFETIAGCNWGEIANNLIIGTADTCASVIAVGAAATSAVVRDNFMVCGDGGTFSVGITNFAYKGLTINNVIGQIDYSGVNDGTVTLAINAGAGLVIQNWLGVGSSADIAGTNTYGMIENYEGTTGGAQADV